MSELARILSHTASFGGKLLKLSHEDKLTVERSLWPTTRPWQGLFRAYTFYVDVYERVKQGDGVPSDAERPRVLDSALDLVDRVARFYGARVVATLSNDVTHVVVDPNDLRRLPAIRSACRALLKEPPHRAKYVVSHEWISESVQQHTDLDESSYIVLS